MFQNFLIHIFLYWIFLKFDIHSMCNLFVSLYKQSIHQKIYTCGGIMILIPKIVEGSCNTCDPECNYIFMNLFTTPDEEGWFFFIFLSLYHAITVTSCKAFPSLSPIPVIMPFFHSHFILFNIHFFVYIDFYKMHVLFVRMFSVYKWHWYNIVFFHCSTKQYLLKTHSFCCERGLDLKVRKEQIP